MDNLKVFIKETICLKPLIQSKALEETIELSGLDRISPAILNTVFFYRSNNNFGGSSSGDVTSSFSENNIIDDAIERAKIALQRVLASWFPAAGRLRFKQGTGKLEIDCNGKGITFITAETFSKLEELGQLNDYKPCYEKLVPQLPHATRNISDNPLVVVQITKFSCGGISIGFGGSHALFDGFGAFNFLACWAHISSGKDESHLTVPNHSRQKLLNAINYVNTTTTTNKSASGSSFSSIYEQEHIAAIQDLYGIPMRAVASDDRRWELELAKLGRVEGREVRLVTLCMNKKVVDTWKGLAVQTGKLSKCSTFDVLCAHVWKARVKALCLEPDTNICLQFPVNCRSRLRPPLGDNFSGNAFVLASASCLAKDVAEEALEGTIRRIQSAKETVGDVDYIKLYVKALEDSSDKFFPSMRELTIATDWLKFPFAALDFGSSWPGKLSALALLGTPVPEAVFLMPDLQQPPNFLVRLGIQDQHLPHFVTQFTGFNYP